MRRECDGIKGLLVLAGSVVEETGGKCLWGLAYYSPSFRYCRGWGGVMGNRQGEDDANVDKEREGKKDPPATARSWNWRPHIVVSKEARREKW